MNPAATEINFGSIKQLTSVILSGAPGNAFAINADRRGVEKSRQRVPCRAIAGSSPQGLLRLNRIPQKTLPTYICIYALFPAFPGHVFQYLFFVPTSRIECINSYTERHAIPS
jgi:hypothetical protein